MLILALDDEPLQLASLTRAISEVSQEAHITSFTKASQALQELENGFCPDVAFIDIEMPGITGVDLAKKIKELSPFTNIIFVTGFSSYAVEAATMHASGYIVKPVTQERIRSELNDLRHPIKNNEAAITVQAFGNFEVFVHGSPINFKSAKAKELFALLVDRRGAGLTTTEIAAVLWEDREYTISLKNQVQKIISQLRTVLAEANCEDILIKGYNSTAIDTYKVSCDYYDFLSGKASNAKAFMGEYMVQYSWAELTTGFLYNQIEK